MYRLIFLNGRLKGRRFAVQQGTLLIGRDPACQIDLADDDLVSRHHAQLEQRKDGVWLKDLGAMNSATVNGEPVHEVKLRAGDRIEVGRTQFEYHPVETTVFSPRRRKSRLHLITLLAVVGILALEAAFIFVFPVWQRNFIPEEPVGNAQTNGEAAVTSELASGPTVTAAPPESISAVNPESGSDASSSNDLSPALQTEVQQLKQAVSGLREQVQALATQPVMAVAPPPPVEPAPQVVVTPPSRPEPEDPLAIKTRELLVLAQTESRKGNWVAADQALERLLILSPDSVPGLVERARVYEKRGLLKEAGAIWGRVLTLTAGTPLYNEAAAERQRLAREETKLAVARAAAQQRGTPAPLPRRVRVVSIDRERFQGNNEFDEMRLIRVHMRPRLNEGRVDVDDLQVWVVFYDRVIGASEVVPTGATVPNGPLRVDTAWDAGEQKTVTATYVVPRNFRADEEVLTGQKRTYEGYRVQIWYKGELQDEDALPRGLLKETMPDFDIPPPSRSALDAPVRR